MTHGRCQVCGRRKGLVADGTIAHHHLRGLNCPGARRLPYELANDALVEALAKAERAAKRHGDEHADHTKRRLNEPLTAAFWAGYQQATSEQLRLHNRLRRRTKMIEREQELIRQRADILAQAERAIHKVPVHLREGLMAYIETGRPVGQFLSAVLCNDLLQAVSYGDDMSLAGLKPVVQFLYNDAPARCWGSPIKVGEWRDHQGLNGWVPA